MNVKSWMVLKCNQSVVTKQMTNKKLGAAKLQP